MKRIVRVASNAILRAGMKGNGPMNQMSAFRSSRGGVTNVNRIAQQIIRASLQHVSAARCMLGWMSGLPAEASRGVEVWGARKA